jgi:hypothetical protein
MATQDETEYNNGQIVIEEVDVDALRVADEAQTEPKRAETQKEMLIECVRQYRHLYDARDKDHHNAIVCQNSWSFIAQKLNSTRKHYTKATRCTHERCDALRCNSHA